jgi:hypothetical protein
VDQAGKIILSNETNTMEENISIGSIPDGFYLLQVKTITGEMYYTRLIKNGITL